MRRILLVSLLLCSYALVHADDALDILRQTVDTEQNIKYRGERKTEFPDTKHAPVVEIVIRDGMRIRSTIVQPERLKGLLVIDDGQRLYVLKPGEDSTTPAPSRQAELSRMTAGLLKFIRQGITKAEVTGTEVVAGRTCKIIQLVTNGMLTHRLWIDEASNVTLKQAEYQFGGKPRFIQSFTRFKSPVKIPGSTFKLPANIKVNEAFVMPAPQYYATVKEAQKTVDFIIRSPKSLPTGYRLVGVRINPFMGRVFVSQHFTNNQYDVTVFQTKVMRGSGLNKFKPTPQHQWISWQQDGIEFGILGMVPYQVMQQFERVMK
ncbi:MAG: LolA family protein [Armatimonadota bacterium]